MRAMQLSAPAALLLCAFIGPLALAQSPNEAATPIVTGPVLGDPHGGSATWIRPQPKIQAQEAPGLGEAATGAIFVSAMTSATMEPSFEVMQGGKHVATSQTGRKVFVQPGVYDVFVGSGGLGNRLEFSATVVEGRVTYVPVEWSGLVVNVVDESGKPFRGSYELVRMPDREYVGLGLGAEIAQGERLSTWLLRAGTYMILAAGESYQARRNFVTFRLPPGRLIQYTLVLDDETGDLLGAGEVSSLVAEEESGWNLSMVLGGSFELNHSDNFVGKSDGITLGGSGFFESFFGYRDDQHIFFGRLNLEAGGDFRVDPQSQPFVADVDELTVDLLYMYRVTSWFGPYTRFSVDTQVLPGRLLFDEPTTVSMLDPEGVEYDRSDRPVESFQLAEPFAPIELSFGTGARFDVSVGSWLKVANRLGIGGRHVFTRGLFVADGFAPVQGTFVVWRRPDEITQFGAEFALVLEANVTRYVGLKMDANLLAPFDDFTRPVTDVRGTLSLRLTSFASINYTARIKIDPELSADTQFDNQVLLRLAYKLL